MPPRSGKLHSVLVPSVMTLLVFTLLFWLSVGTPGVFGAAGPTLPTSWSFVRRARDRVTVGELSPAAIRLSGPGPGMKVSGVSVFMSPAMEADPFYRPRDPKGKESGQPTTSVMCDGKRSRPAEFCPRGCAAEGFRCPEDAGGILFAAVCDCAERGSVKFVPNVRPGKTRELIRAVRNSDGSFEEWNADAVLPVKLLGSETGGMELETHVPLKFLGTEVRWSIAVENSTSFSGTSRLFDPAPACPLAPTCPPPPPPGTDVPEGSDEWYPCAPCPTAPTCPTTCPPPVIPPGCPPRFRYATVIQLVMVLATCCAVLGLFIYAVYREERKKSKKDLVELESLNEPLPPPPEF